MSDDNKLNLLYFEGRSMRGLYEIMENWQKENHKRLLSVNIQKEGGILCCIALTNYVDVNVSMWSYSAPISVSVE